MNGIGSEIAMIASELALGESVRTICPQCDGGSTREKSLNITLTEEGLAWICFRNNCELRGRSNAAGIPRVKAEKPKPKRKVFEGKTIPLSEKHRERIAQLWGIHDPEHWYWTDSHGGRVAMSIRGPKYTHRGWLLRDIYGTHGVKALTYIDDGEEGLAWYKTKAYAPTFVVEDVPSAVRASKYVNSIALLGTGVGIPRAAEIAEYATRPVVVALDQDATAEAFKVAKRWALFWEDVIVQPLKKDIKDMTEPELEQLMKGYTNNE